MRPSDFRSDTVTRPSRGMLEAMMSAELGDDVLDGDPTVRALEQRVAAWLGKDDAIFVPSGTMANQAAVGAWTRPGEVVVAERGAHVVFWEAGAIGANHGVQALTLFDERGRIDPEELAAVIRRGTMHEPRTALVCTEETYMGSGDAPGGRIVPLEGLEAVREVTAERGVAVHMDGARLANAVVATGIPAERWAGTADSVSLCLSKGLGAPVGSVLASSDADFMERARKLRKRLGGWMRQAGILAAAGLWGLEHQLARLAEDHARARRLAELLNGFEGLRCAPEDVDTNIVVVQVDRAGFTARSLAAALEEYDVRALPMGARGLRFVTHLDVDDADVERACEALRRILDA